MVELGKAGSHFAASRSRCGYNNQRTGGFNIFVLAVAFVADNERNVAWITGNGIMQIYTDSQVFQLGFKSHGAGLTGKLCDDNAAYEKASVLKGIHQAQHVKVIGNPQIPSDFIFLYIAGTDNDDDFRMVRKLFQHFQLAVRGESRQNPGSVVVVEKFASELQIQLVIELTDTFFDMFGLHG